MSEGAPNLETASSASSRRPWFPWKGRDLKRADLARDEISAKFPRTIQRTRVFLVIGWFGTLLFAVSMLRPDWLAGVNETLGDPEGRLVSWVYKEQVFPEHGHVPQLLVGDVGAPLTVLAPMMGVMAEVTVTNVKDSKKTMSLYVRGGGKVVSVSIPAGRYKVLVYMGQRWFGEASKFGPLGKTYEVPSILTFEAGSDGHLVNL